MCEECIVFTRERSEEAVFSGENYISIKVCMWRVFLVTLRWRIFWVKDEEFINREFANWNEASIGHSWKGSGDMSRLAISEDLMKVRGARRPQEGEVCPVFSASTRVLEAEVWDGALPAYWRRREQKDLMLKASWASGSQWQETWLGIQYYFCLKVTLNHQFKVSFRTEVPGV